VIGPCITLVFALIGWAIIPFGEGLAIFDYELGVFFALAVSSIGSYGILISGWAANSKYAFMGAIRSTAQLLSYELVFSSILLILIMFSGSFSLTFIVECQQAVWNIFPLLPIALMFLIAILAETNRPPFDLPEARFGLLYDNPMTRGYYLIKSSLYAEIFFCYHNIFISNFYIFMIWDITISKITFLLKYMVVYSNLQRLNVNIIIWIIKYVYEYEYFINSSYFFMIESYIFFHISENVNNNINSFFTSWRICLKFKYNNILPPKFYDNIHESKTISLIEKELKDLKDVYGFLCKSNHKIFIGSSENLVKRFKEHIKGKKSNIRLQRAISKYGLNNFYYIIEVGIRRIYGQSI
jgi:hypothetical protein